MKDKAGMSSRCIPFEQEHLRRRVPRVRQARQVHDLLGRGVLSRARNAKPTARCDRSGRFCLFIFDIKDLVQRLHRELHDAAVVGHEAVELVLHIAQLRVHRGR